MYDKNQSIFLILTVVFEHYLIFKKEFRFISDTFSGTSFPFNITWSKQRKTVTITEFSRRKPSRSDMEHLRRFSYTFPVPARLFLRTVWGRRSAKAARFKHDARKSFQPLQGVSAKNIMNERASALRIF